MIDNNYEVQSKLITQLNIKEWIVLYDDIRKDIIKEYGFDCENDN